MYICIVNGRFAVKGKLASRGGVVENRRRVWIVQYDGPRPDTLEHIPAGATAVEPAERGTMTPRQAREYVEAFNRAAQNGSRKIWAVALPVSVRYVGDPQPGQALA